MTSKQTPQLTNIHTQESQTQPSYRFISAYSPKTRSQIQFTTPGRTKQSFKDECDINVIMRRYQVTGELVHLNQRSPLFGDFPDMDFQSAMAIVIQARENFATLPSEVRDRFANDPGRLLSFLQDPANREEAIKLGLVRIAEQPAPTPEPSPPV